jgi:hypothetical protein
MRPEAATSALSPRATAAYKELRALRKSCADCAQLALCDRHGNAMLMRILRFTRRPMVGVSSTIPSILALVAPELQRTACRNFESRGVNNDAP